MLQLAASSEFRQAAQRVVAELKDAGVDLTSQVSYVSPVVIFYIYLCTFSSGCHERYNGSGSEKGG